MTAFAYGLVGIVDQLVSDNMFEDEGAAAAAVSSRVALVHKDSSKNIYLDLYDYVMANAPAEVTHTAISSSAH